MGLQGLDNTTVKGKSSSGTWRDCTVVKHKCGNPDSPLESLSILLHFDGFASKYDEWVDMSKQADRVTDAGGAPLMEALSKAVAAAQKEVQKAAAAVAAEAEVEVEEAAVNAASEQGTVARQGN
jgi:hypothetical protein